MRGALGVAWIVTLASSIALSSPRRLPPEARPTRPPTDAFQDHATSGKRGARITMSSSVPPRVGEPTAITIACSSERAGDCAGWTQGRVHVDVEMPEHDHGLRVAPEIRVEGARATAAPVRFHMPGWWRVIVAVVEDGRTVDWAVLNIDVSP